MLAESAQATIDTPPKELTRNRLRSSIGPSRRDSITQNATNIPAASANAARI